jgi:hypothetical protein
MGHPIRDRAGLSPERMQNFSAFAKRVEPGILSRSAEFAKTLVMSDVFAFGMETTGRDMVWIAPVVEAHDHLVPTLQDTDHEVMTFVQQRLAMQVELYQLRAVFVGSWGTVGVVLDIVDPGSHGAS